MSSRDLAPSLLALALAFVLALAAGDGRADPPPPAPPPTNPAPSGETEEAPAETPELRPAPALGALVGRPISAIEVRLMGDRWIQPVQVRTVRIGDRLTPALARGAARELADTGRYARVSVSAEASGTGVILRLSALPRRLIASVTVAGGKLEEEAMLAEARIAVGGEITSLSLPQMIARIRAFYGEHGYRQADASIDLRETDDPMKVALVVRVEPGPESTVSRRVFVRDGPAYSPDVDLDAELSKLEQSYTVEEGDGVDEEQLAAADRTLLERMRAAQYHRARVQHQVLTKGPHVFLYVRINPGPKFHTRYEGLHYFDGDQIDRSLDLDKEFDKSLRHLSAKVADFYIRRGFLDVEVAVEERGGPADRVHVFFFTVREHGPVRVVSREFPCLGGGPLSGAEARRDIDSFLDEELPGSGLLGAVDPAAVDTLLGPTAGTGTRVAPLELAPRATYVAETYDRALKHLQDYYRSQGYLSATVGPQQLVRRQCARRSPYGQCIPVETPVKVQDPCSFDPGGLPIEEPPADPRLLCVPDPKKGVTCEPSLRVRVPIKLGPRTMLHDIAFEGNRVLVEQDLADQADLELGGPVSQTEIEAARARVLDAFKEQGFAFAEVRAVLDFSTDRTRARLRFIITEGERVYVDGIVVRGAKRTNPSLILRRVSFERCPRDRPIDQCQPYRASDVRKSEERIATLGTFSSVSISLEDPQVPARRKIVIVEVQERVPQYLDLRPGFSTGEGFRTTLEYGHRNVAGQAIQLTVRVQFGYLPDAFILDPDVQENYDKLTVAQRLERRDTVSVVFPEVGLGPLIRFGLDGIDVRDNARDFGLTKDAALATLTYRPTRSFYAQLGGSLERNDVGIFRGGTVTEYLQEVARSGGSIVDLSRLLRVPEGLTFAIAERLSATWDRRDNAFGATRGTLLVGGVEHVHAYPDVEDPACHFDPMAPTSVAPGTRPVSEQDYSGPPRYVLPVNCASDFFRFTGTVAGYVRLTEGGLAVAVSLRGGRIQHLMRYSKTYPDRLFFLGGVDSLRGFLQDSLVPEDIAERILHPGPEHLEVQNVAIRGGDVFINPRVELRIPFSGIWEGGLFLDTGNVWVDPKNFDPFKLRYAAGAGIRIGTPIGPIAFDYGINLIRREWEDFGNFHFSIGLF